MHRPATAWPAQRDDLPYTRRKKKIRRRNAGHNGGVTMDETIRAEAQAQLADNTGRSAPFVTECDLVMKGGITSGVVYPLAIVEIAKAFRLRSIGGTSAGAIAAAAAAAAELGRQRHIAGELKSDPDGFGQLAGLPAFLGGTAALRRSAISNR